MATMSLKDHLRPIRGLLLALLLGTATIAPAPADPVAELTPLPRPAPPAPDPAETAIFAMPRSIEESRAVLARLRGGGDLADAIRRIDELLDDHPESGLLHANRAALAMIAGEEQQALDLLERAASLGLPDPAAIAGDPVFAPLAADPAHARRLAAVADAPPLPADLPEPTPVRNGIARVAATGTRWDSARERLEPAFAFPEEPAARAVLPGGPKEAARDLLREHWRRGRAAGNHGDLYDNRDRGHSALDPADFPQLTHVVYPEAARAADIDYGLNDRLLFGHPTFGNSSTAITSGAHWRSLPRHALTRPDGTGPMRLWQNWAANHLYVHPAHRDYSGRRGDLFPANTPYLLVARGSSGSERPFLEAIAMILASFRPETKARLIEENLVAPTVQMVFRRSLQNVRSRESYFSGDAHPAAFAGSQINLARMVSLAQSIAPDAIPAETRLRVVEEELGEEGIDFFGEGLSEQLFDTPSAVARIWRSARGRRSMILSAEESSDPNGRPLTFHWRLLQGDPDRVRIEPEADGRRARITIDWHDPFPISDEDPQLTSRVDIGVFASNGAHDSAPAILSWYFPSHETRHYEEGPDGVPRILSIDHADPEKADVYADPLLLPRADWRDVYDHDAEGQLTGWRRFRDGSESGNFTADGRRIETGREAADEARPVTHALVPGPRNTLRIEERPAP